MLDVKPYTFNNNILKAWLRCILLAEQVRKPNLWIAHNNTSFVREDLSDVVTSLAKHFKEGELTLTPTFSPLYAKWPVGEKPSEDQ